MKKRISIISFLITLVVLLTSCSYLTGKANISHLRIKESKLDSINFHYHFGEKDATLNEEETDKFIELFNNITTGIIPEGELCTPDLIVTIKYNNSKKTVVYFYGEDYPTIEIKTYDKDGKQDEWYYFHADELRNFAYETAKKITVWFLLLIL